MSEEQSAIEQLLEIKKKEQQAKQISAIAFMLLLAGSLAYCSYLNNQVEADKKWCREAKATEFVNQFETKCMQYRDDPVIAARIDRILAGKEKK